jgi:two-component system, response regulator YesN
MDDQLNTLIVIEDEIAVRRSIIGKIRREKLPLSVQGEYQNAEEAYVKIKESPPEIILLDMRMPGMGGMKFLEILAKEFPDIQVIVLSGYSEFEYLQKAIKCGAKDYLLKPVVREDLKNALMKAIAQIKEMQQKKKKDEKLDLFLKHNIPLFKANVLNRLIQGEEQTNYYEELKQFGEDAFKSYLFINGKIKNFSELKELNLLKNGNISERIESMLTKDFGKPLTLSNLGNNQYEDEFQCIFGFEEDDQRISHFRPKLEKSINSFKETDNIALHLTISNFYKDIYLTRDQYVDSIYTTLTLGSEPSLSFKSDLHDHSSKPLLDSNEIEQMLTYVKGYNRKKIVSTVNKWFRTLKGSHDLTSAQKLAIEILNSIEGTLLKVNDSKIAHSSNSKMFTFYDFIKTYKNIEDIKYRVITSLFTIAEKNEKRLTKQTNSLILEAKKIIDEKFHEEITLESIANKHHMNKSYFSELFKEEIGLTFNKYLNWVRIEKAKELLVVHDMNATKISELVGYKDHVYFSIVFKKFTGLPPGEFKQRNKGIS